MQKGYTFFFSSDLVSTASMWTKKEIEVFKSAIRKEGGDSIIKVGHGETVTIRVPTHEEGTAIFWEFATVTTTCLCCVIVLFIRKFCSLGLVRHRIWPLL